MAEQHDACTTTGAAALYVRSGPEKAEIMTLIRLGLRFRAQQVGKRPGFLHLYVCGIIARMAPPITFEALLDELGLAAIRREAGDARREPIERVSRVYELVTFHDPTRGRQQVTFGRLRNIFTAAKKARFPPCPKP